MRVLSRAMKIALCKKNHNLMPFWHGPQLAGALAERSERPMAFSIGAQSPVELALKAAEKLGVEEYAKMLAEEGYVVVPPEVLC